MLAQVIEKHSKSKKVSLVSHDFGCVFALYLRSSRPELVKRIALADVTLSGIDAFESVPIVLSYQMFNIFCFLLGGTGN